MITAFIKRQSIEVSSDVIVAESYNYLKVQFVFSSNDWNGLEKTAYFKQGNNEPYAVRLDENNIAHDINLSAGEWKIYVVGKELEYGELVERITTDSAIINVIPFEGGGETPLPSVEPTEADRIDAKIGNLLNLLTGNKTDIVNAINEIYLRGGGGGGGGSGEISAEIIKQIDANTENRHWHNNKIILDGIGYNEFTDHITFRGSALANQGDIPRPIDSTAINNYFLLQTPIPYGHVDNRAVTELIDEINARFAKKSEVNGGGGNGVDGFSPIVDVEEIEGGHRVTITDADGTESFDVLNGYTPVKGVDYFDGKDGINGKDGNDYVLTEADKTEIANAVIDLLPKYNGEVAEV